jgi:hypothetical protein
LAVHADLVITVTEDRRLLLQELKHLRVEIVPTMHDVALDDAKDPEYSGVRGLIFA